MPAIPGCARKSMTSRHRYFTEHPFLRLPGRPAAAWHYQQANESHPPIFGTQALFANPVIRMNAW